MPSKTDIQLAHLAGEIEATQLVLTAYLTGIAEASLGGHEHIEAVFRMASRLADSAAGLAGGGKQRPDRASRVQTAIANLKALTL